MQMQKAGTDRVGSGTLGKARLEFGRDGCTSARPLVYLLRGWCLQGGDGGPFRPFRTDCAT
jgi:hypothetical protein